MELKATKLKHNMRVLVDGEWRVLAYWNRDASDGSMVLYFKDGHRVETFERVTYRVEVER